VPLYPERLARARLSPFVGTGYRHVSPKYDPLSGEGARINGGRFNPPGSFPVLYLCLTRECAVAELCQAGQRQAIGVEGLLPRRLYRYNVALDRVLDLTDPRSRTAVGVSSDVLTGPDWKGCQELGSAGHALGVQAIRSPSATGVDDVLAVFVQNLGLGTLEPELVEEWGSVHELEQRTDN
jgi:RES domain-containing protein